MNPSYNEIDKKDMLEDADQIGLALRQKAILEQLTLKIPRFYAVDKCFKRQIEGVELKGTGDWWERMLFSGNPPLLTKDDINKVFVLERFPYHAKKLPSQRLLTTIRTEHTTFWEKLVCYAYKSQKTIIVRKTIANQVLQIIGNDAATHLLTFSSQRAMLSVGNLIELPYRTSREQESKDRALCRLRKSLGR